MREQLARGFMSHVYLFSSHYLIVQLKVEGACFTDGLVHSLMPTIMDEMFGLLNEEKSIDETNKKKHIKESKGRKSLPLIDLLASHINFNRSFLTLIEPFLKVLDSNPSLQKV